MFYAGIGSRQTPQQTLVLMAETAYQLRQAGWTLRSGGANGADLAFEIGAGHAKEIYLPWRGFNGSRSLLHDISPEAYAMAEKFHPAWNRCSPAARKFHARNCYQVLGYSLRSPSTFVLCWTPRGEVTGGTGQAMRIAMHNGIPVINMFHDTWREQLTKFMPGMSETDALDYYSGPEPCSL
jgi:hypothetical protein